MSNIKNRLNKINQQLNKDDDETIIMVYIDGADSTDSSCSMRRDECPPYPCNDSKDCWFSNRYQNAKRIVMLDDVEE